MRHCDGRSPEGCYLFSRLILVLAPQAAYYSIGVVGYRLRARLGSREISLLVGLFFLARASAERSCCTGYWTPERLRPLSSQGFWWVGVVAGAGGISDSCSRSRAGYSSVLLLAAPIFMSQGRHPPPRAKYNKAEIVG